MKIAHRKKAPSFSELDSTNVPWHKDPILKYAWRIPLIIFVPFFLFLSRHTLGRIFGYLSDHIWFIIVPVAVFATIVVAVLMTKANKRKKRSLYAIDGDELGLAIAFCVVAVVVILPLVVIGFAFWGNNAAEKSSEFQTNYPSSTTRTLTERVQLELQSEALIHAQNEAKFRETPFGSDSKRRERMHEAAKPFVKREAKALADEWERLTGRKTSTR